jgi:hypothetical protein
MAGKQIQRTPRTHRGAVLARDETPLVYIALQHLRIGERHVEPGDELKPSDLKGRNIASMLRHSQIQQVIKPVRRKAVAR